MVVVVATCRACSYNTGGSTSNSTNSISSNSGSIRGAVVFEL